MDKKAIFKIGRDNHLNNLLGRLPFLSIIYVLQCYMVYSYMPDVNVGDFAIYMGIFLIGFVLSLYVHDKYHHVIIYKSHMIIYFEPLRVSKKILYDDIIDIVAPTNECDYSSIFLKLKDDRYVSLHFVDYPLQVKEVILELKKNSNLTQSAA